MGGGERRIDFRRVVGGKRDFFVVVFISSILIFLELEFFGLLPGEVTTTEMAVS
jgi:hypothetical protein